MHMRECVCVCVPGGVLPNWSCDTVRWRWCWRLMPWQSLAHACLPACPPPLPPLPPHTPRWSRAATQRSDVVHPPGPLTYRDLVSILPMMDETCVLRVSGAQLLAALENGVSMWPRQEGRFPQVSGVRFAFDPTLPPGARVVPGSVVVGAAPLDLQAAYSLATKEYLAEGRDGYDCLEASHGPFLCHTGEGCCASCFTRLVVLLTCIAPPLALQLCCQTLSTHAHTHTTLLRAVRWSWMARPHRCCRQQPGSCFW